jgi:hypothetical protein
MRRQPRNTSKQRRRGRNSLRWRRKREYRRPSGWYRRRWRNRSRRARHRASCIRNVLGRHRRRLVTFLLERCRQVMQHHLDMVQMAGHVHILFIPRCIYLVQILQQAVYVMCEDLARRGSSQVATSMRRNRFELRDNRRRIRIWCTNTDTKSGIRRRHTGPKCRSPRG